MVSKKIVLITGGNAGLGYETVKTLMESSISSCVFMGSRSVQKTEAAIVSLNASMPNSATRIEPLQMEIASEKSIETTFAAVQKTTDHIDMLVNNADISLPKICFVLFSHWLVSLPHLGHSLEPAVAKGTMSLRKCRNRTYDVNASSTDIMTRVFMPPLLRSADPRLLFVTSGLSSQQEAITNYHSGNPPEVKGWP